MRLTRQLEKVFDQFNATFYGNYMGTFASNCLEFVPLCTAYYRGVGVSKSVLASIQEKATRIVAERIGVVPGETLKVIPGSYLSKLLTADKVRTEVRQFVVNAISGRQDYATFAKGFRDKILGTEEKEGAMLRYMKQYAYDTYSQTQRTTANILAEFTGMENYWYHGTIIETSREFCQDHVDTLITPEDIDLFDKIDWAGKIEGVPFIIQCGGYNCRHFLDAVPQEAIQEEEQ